MPFCQHSDLVAVCHVCRWPLQLACSYAPYRFRDHSAFHWSGTFDSCLLFYRSSPTSLIHSLTRSSYRVVRFLRCRPRHIIAVLGHHVHPFTFHSRRVVSRGSLAFSFISPLKCRLRIVG